MTFPFRHDLGRPEHRAVKYNHPHSIAWTDENVETLKRLWEEGLSTSQIAAALGDPGAKNSIIGKAHRIGLTPRRSSYGPKQIAPPKVKPPRTSSGAIPRNGRSGMSQPKCKLVATQSEPLPDPCSPAPDSLMLGYFEPNAGCRYLFGDERDIFNVRVCGAPSVNESSWCRCHWQAIHARDNGHTGDSRPDLAAQNRRAAPSPIVLAVLSDREDRAA